MAKLNSKKTEKLCANEEKSLVGSTPGVRDVINGVPDSQRRRLSRCRGTFERCNRSLWWERRQELGNQLRLGLKVGFHIIIIFINN